MFTIFCIFALYNAINFIDGYNGCATSIIIFWTFILLVKNPNVHINTKVNTGNIYIKNNSLEFINNIVKKKSSKFITADGGFDYSTDFNKQEISSYKLIFCEIFISMNIQAEGGNFIIKVFDIFYHEKYT